MKRGFVLLMSLILLVFVSFVAVLSLQISSYTPRQIKDLRLYTQAQILAHNSVELAQYLLVKAKAQGQECLNFTQFHYPSAKDSVRIDYFYPLQECENGRLTHTNADTNLSKDNVIILNISILLNAGKAVNDEIFINKKAYIYPNENF